MAEDVTLSLTTARARIAAVAVVATFLSTAGCRASDVAASIAPKQIFPGPTLTITDGAGNRRGEIFYTVADGYRLVTLQTVNSAYRLILDVGGRGGWFDSSRNRSMKVFSGNAKSPLLDVSFNESGLGRNHLLLRSNIGWNQLHEEPVTRHSLWNAIKGWDGQRANGAVSTQQLILTDNTGSPIVAFGSDGPVTVAALIYNELHQPAAFWQTTPHFESIGVLDPFGHAWVYLDFKADQVPSFTVVDEDGSFYTGYGATGEMVEDSAGQPNTSWPHSWLSLRSPSAVLPFAAWDGNQRLVWRGP